MKSKTGLYSPLFESKIEQNPISTALKVGVRWSCEPRPIAHERCYGRTSLSTEFSDSLLGGCPRIDYYQKVLFLNY